MAFGARQGSGMVNLGCGRDIRPGWVNVDRHRAPGVDVVANIEKEGLPFTDQSVSVVYASHVLEHVVDLDAVVREIHRILMPGGIFEVRVPYGLKFLYDPWHFHAFDALTLTRFTTADRGLQSAALFSMRSLRVYRGPPFVWHIRKYLPWLHRWIYRPESGRQVAWPLSWRHREIHAIMEKR